MVKYLQDKKKAVMLVAAVLLIVVLVLILLVTLSQKTMLSRKEEQLHKMLDDYNSQKISLEEWEQYKKSNEYYVEWAKKQGMLNDDETQWIKK